jgi:hypothetical protein
VFRLLALLLTSDSSAFTFTKDDKNQLWFDLRHGDTARLLRSTRHRIKEQLIALEAIGVLEELSHYPGGSRAILKPSRNLILNFLK